jgi:hypothetical protein
LGEEIEYPNSATVQLRQRSSLTYVDLYFLRDQTLEGGFGQNRERNTKLRLRMIIDVLQKAGCKTYIPIALILTDGKEEDVGINSYVFHFLPKARLILSLVALASSSVTAQTILPLISTTPPWGSWFLSGS